jgi:hypothetical protein
MELFPTHRYAAGYLRIIHFNKQEATPVEWTFCSILPFDSVSKGFATIPITHIARRRITL